MFSEDDFIQLAALQHYIFCPRQCGMIHIEQLWADNFFTARGNVLHEKVHQSDIENRPGISIVRGLKIHSFRLGLSGQADVVEFHPSKQGITLDGKSGKWQPFPVEYKRGKTKTIHCDRIQLCAQSLCLEEMLKIRIPAGAIYYNRPKKREYVELTDELRTITVETAEAVHQLIELAKTPLAKYTGKCKSCSLYRQCMPKITGVTKKIDHYLSKANEIPRELAEQ